MAKLTAVTVKNAKPGRHADGDGLYLLVKPTGAKSWLLRIQVDGQRRDIGWHSRHSPRAVGKARVTDRHPHLQRKLLTLGEARDKAGMLRAAAKAASIDCRARPRAAADPHFRDAAKFAHEALKEGWTVKGAKTFLSSLENHASARSATFASMRSRERHQHGALVNLDEQTRYGAQGAATDRDRPQLLPWQGVAATESPGNL
jgi:hypothetical protein